MLKSGILFLLTFSACAGTNLVLADEKFNEAIGFPLISQTLLLDAAATEDSRILVGERGLVFYSKAGGPWRKIELPTGATLTTVHFHNSNLGWAAGHDAVIFKTIDGGEHWRQVYSDPEAETPLLDIWFSDAQNGIAIGAYGLYLITHDGGDSWTVKEMQVNDAPDTGDEDAVFDLAETYDLHLNAIARSASGKLYIAAEAGRIYRSDDLGHNWRELPSPYAGSLFGVLPLPDDVLLVFGLRGHLFRSDDAGRTWTEIETGTREMLTSGIRLRDGKIVIAGMGGAVLGSNDGGHTFSLKEFTHRNSYAAVIEDSAGSLLFVGDHGMQFYSPAQLGFAHE